MTPSEPSSPLPPMLTIISGAQDNAALAGLDVAIERGIPHGGWCPKGRQSQGVRLLSRYQLAQTPTANPLVCTERNIVESDATVLFKHAGHSGDSRRVADLTQANGKPLLEIMLPAMSDLMAAEHIVAFIHSKRVSRLNLAGPHGRKDTNVYHHVFRVLNMALDQLGIPAKETGSFPELTLGDLTEIYVRRHEPWTKVVHDLELSNNASDYLLACLPCLRHDSIDDCGIDDMLPSGAGLLNFLSRNGLTSQLVWLPDRVNFQLSITDAEGVRTSRVHDFADPERMLPELRGKAFDQVVLEMVLDMKNQGQLENL